MTDQTQAEHELEEARAGKDEFMRDDPHSPLDEGQAQSFTGLKYYPFNPDLRLSLPFDTDVPHDTVTMSTSTGGDQEYRRAGHISFDVEGQPAQLSVYASDGQLFLPLRDATSGKETYGAGRYLEPELLAEGTILVDFNYLYNPYCAYNEMWSCPLPPIENWLQVPIRAGEKKFHD